MLHFKIKYIKISWLKPTTVSNNFSICKKHTEIEILREIERREMEKKPCDYKKLLKLLWIYSALYVEQIVLMHVIYFECYIDVLQTEN